MSETRIEVPSNLPTPINEAINAINDPLILISSAYILYKIASKKLAGWYDRFKLRVSYSHKQEKKIETQLAGMLALTGADRVLLLERHNGTHTSTGRDLHKLSATKEVVAPGVKAVGHHYLGLPLNLMDNFLTKLEENKHARVSIDELDTCAPLYDRLVEDGVEYLVANPIFHREFMVGIFFLQFSDEEKFNSYSEAMTKQQEGLVAITITQENRQGMLTALQEVSKGVLKLIR